MAAKIKLTRIGAKKQPTYRVVIQEEHSKRDGRFIENLGYYNPRTDPPTIVLNRERLDYWLGVGARPTDSVGQLIKTAGITDKYYRMKTSKKGAAGEASKATPPSGETSAGVTPEGTDLPPKVSSDNPV